MNSKNCPTRCALLVILFIVIVSPIYGQCGDCKFIQTLVADAPNLFRNLRDCDGTLRIAPAEHSVCSYTYRSNSENATVSCQLFTKDYAESNARYDADVAALPRVLGSEWQLHAAQSLDMGDGTSLKSLAGKNRITGVVVNLSLFGADKMGSSIRISVSSADKTSLVF